jgi:hypothetical protein
MAWREGEVQKGSTSNVACCIIAWFDHNFCLIFFWTTRKEFKPTTAYSGIVNKRATPRASKWSEPEQVICD